jgi:hypothetical protein
VLPDGLNQCLGGHFGHLPQQCPCWVRYQPLACANASAAWTSAHGVQHLEPQNPASTGWSHWMITV